MYPLGFYEWLDAWTGGMESGRVAKLFEQSRCPLDCLFLRLGRLRGLVHLKDRCCHRNLTPKELNRLEAGRYITLSAGELLGQEGL